MVGTVIFAMLPLYLTKWQDAVYDGALLIIAVAFSSDAAFRCFDPANKKGNWSVAFGVGSMALLALALLQYGPIANDLRRERIALQASVTQNSSEPLVSFEKQREEDERELPNSSSILLIASIVAEFSVNSIGRELDMGLSWEALGGITIAVVMFVAAVYRRVNAQRKARAEDAGDRDGSVPV
jgi:hypothetical protein